MTDSLEALAARAAQDPFFLAWTLAGHALSEGFDDAALAAALGCPARELAMLRLCRAPGSDPTAFRDDIDCIAARFGLEADRLAEAVKRGQVVRRFQRADPAAGNALMAARDRDAEPPDAGGDS